MPAPEPGLGPLHVDEEALVAWGTRVGARVEPPLWIALAGPLGSGKSVLARAICRGAGIDGHIPSPSFSLVRRYRSPRGFDIYHVDLFRLGPGETMEPLGWDELLAVPGLILVEWATRAGEQQPGDRWEALIEYGRRPDERVLTVARIGTAPELVPW